MTPTLSEQWHSQYGATAALGLPSTTLSEQWHSQYGANGATAALGLPRTTYVIRAEPVKYNSHCSKSHNMCTVFRGPSADVYLLQLGDFSAVNAEKHFTAICNKKCIFV